jgi:hypothetical protein
MSIGASAISGMTMARLHAVTGSQWRRTVRIAGKSAFLARARLSPPDSFVIQQTGKGRAILVMAGSVMIN